MGCRPKREHILHFTPYTTGLLSQLGREFAKVSACMIHGFGSCLLSDQHASFEFIADASIKNIPNVNV